MPVLPFLEDGDDCDFFPATIRVSLMMMMMMMMMVMIQVRAFPSPCRCPSVSECSQCAEDLNVILTTSGFSKQLLKHQCTVHGDYRTYQVNCR